MAIDWAAAYGGGGGTSSSSSSSGIDWAGHYGGGGGVSIIPGTPKSGGGGGILGSLEHAVESIPGSNIASNFVHGAYEAGANLPSGIEHLVEHPIGSAEAIGHMYKQKYLPIIEHPLSGKSYRGVYNDPFGTFLDALTIATVPFTFGGSVAARAGLVGVDAGRAGELARVAAITSPEDRAAELGKLGDLSTGERLHFNALKNKTPIQRSVEEIPGEKPTNYLVRPARTPWGRSLQSKALDIRESPRVVPAHLPFGGERIADIPGVGASYKIAKKANVNAIRETQKARAFLDKSRKIIQEHKLSEAEAFGLHIARQGVPLDSLIPMYEKVLEAHPDPNLDWYVGKLKDPAVRDALENPSKRMIKADHQLAKVSTRATEARIKSGDVTREQAELRRALPARMAGGARHDAETGGLVGGPDPMDVVAKLDEANAVHPDFHPATYWPHHPPLPEAKAAGAYRLKPPNMLSRTADASLRTNTGHNFLHAAYGISPEDLMNEFMRTSRYSHKKSAFEGVVLPAARDLNADIPGGKHESEFYVKRENPNAKVPHHVREQEVLAQQAHSYPGEALSKQERDAIANEARQEVFQAHEAPTKEIGDAIKYNDIGKLNELGIGRVHQAYGDRYRSDFGGTSGTARQFDRGLGLWRMLNMYGKPAYSVHNIAQQWSLMAIQHPGAFREMAQLVRDPKLRAAIEDSVPGVKESGAFSVLAKGVRKGVYSDKQAGRIAKTLGLPLRTITSIPKTWANVWRELNVRYAENLPREAVFLNQFKKGLHDSAVSLDEAIRTGDPAHMEASVDSALDSLGDWNTMSDFERKYLARLMPIAYPWFRTITAVSGKMIVRYPGRLDFLHALAQSAPPGSPVPSWLKGAITFGGRLNGVQTMLETGALNPFATFSQTADQPVASQLNPLLTAGITGLTGQDLFTGGKYYGPGAQFGAAYPYDPSHSNSAMISRGVGSLIGENPIFQAVQAQHPYTQGLYAPHTYGHAGPVKINDQILAYLGFPVKHVRLAKAKADSNR